MRVAEHVVSRMLADSPPDVLERMVAGGAVVAIIGRRQVTTDIPAHAFMRWSEGERAQKGGRGCLMPRSKLTHGRLLGAEYRGSWALGGGGGGR